MRNKHIERIRDYIAVKAITPAAMDMETERYIPHVDANALDAFIEGVIIEDSERSCGNCEKNGTPDCPVVFTLDAPDKIVQPFRCSLHKEMSRLKLKQMPGYFVDAVKLK